MPTFTEAEYKLLKASVEENEMLVKQLIGKCYYDNWTKHIIGG